MSSNNIIRCAVGKNFTMVSNVGMRDVNLSFKAKGLLAYLIGLPEDWVISLEDLRKRSTDGKLSITSGMNELMKFGYCLRESVRDNDGKYNGVVYKVSDEPIFLASEASDPLSENRLMGNPCVEVPLMEKSTLQRNNKTKTQEQTNIVATLEFEGDRWSSYKKNQKTIFANCPLSDPAIYESAFISKHQELVHGGVNLEYYRMKVLNWSDKQDTKTLRTYRGWNATLLDFMDGDKKRGQLQVVSDIRANNADKLDQIESFTNRQNLK